MAGPSKGHHPFAAPQGAKQHARKTGGTNGRSHDIQSIPKPKHTAPTPAVKLAENAKQGEHPLRAQKLPGVVHTPKNVRTP